MYCGIIKVTKSLSVGDHQEECHILGVKDYAEFTKTLQRFIR